MSVVSFTQRECAMFVMEGCANCVEEQDPDADTGKRSWWLNKKRSFIWMVAAKNKKTMKLKKELRTTMNTV